MEELTLQKVQMDGFTPFSANVVTYQERALLPSGTYTVAQNVRDFRPGLKKRPGLADISPYNYLGQTVDIRPVYGDTDGGGGPVYIGVVSGYSNLYATQAQCRANPADTSTNGSEHTTTMLAPGWRTSGGNFQMGRVGVSINLSRYLPYVTTVTSASLFIYVKGYEGPDSDINENYIRLCLTDPDEIYLPTGISVPGNGLIEDAGSTLYADALDLDPTAYGSDHIVEIPLNAAGIASINSAFSSSVNGRVTWGCVIREYDWDYLADTGGDPNDTINHYLNQRVDRYFPFLRITFSDEPPACISIYQYDQIRSATSETLAYFTNKDIISANVAPPVTRGDVRPTVTGGDNGGYYPYSDGTPSSNYGLSFVTTWSPSYDSKWGKFIYRDGGLQAQGKDWTDNFYDAFAGEITTTELSNFKPSWGVLDDILIFANGDGYAKFYGGQAGQPCKASCVVIDPAGGDTGTFRDDWDVDGITLDFPASGTTSTYCYLYSPVLTDRLLYSVIDDNNYGVATWEYWSGYAWWNPGSNAVEDTTIDGGDSFAQDGYIYSEKFLDNKPQRLFGLSGYWLRFKMSSSSADFTGKFKVFYNFTELSNVWDGVYVDFVEALFFDNSATSDPYYTYGNTTIDISEMTTSDYVYFSSQYVPKDIYATVGNTPNTNSVSLTFEYWDGTQWVTWTTLTDGSEGFRQSGLINMSPQTAETASQKQGFNGSPLQLHWFRLSVSGTVSDNCRIGLTYQPILNLDDFGTKTTCAAVWKERAVYVFDNYPSWINVTKNGTVNVLNGDDYTPLQAGDGRRNAVVCMRKFHNELLTWQEEKGDEGGCTTIFEGYNPTTFGKFLLSAKIGTLNADTAVVVDGALQASRTDYAAATLAYFLSNYGVFYTDGQTIKSIHEPIRNYFDPTSADCIRHGYQQYCWLTYDETHHVLRMGLVSGSSATQPNVFPVFDLITRRWSFDAFASAHTPRCMSEIGGDSSTSAVQVAVLAGSLSGDIYHASSTNLNDNGDTAIDMQVRIEFSANGHLMNINEYAVRFKRQVGNIICKVYENGVENTDMAKTVDMEQFGQGPGAGGTGEEAFTDRLMIGAYQDNNVSVFMQNNVIDQDMYLFDYWVDMDKLINR
jgi:hypothetical protein